MLTLKYQGWFQCRLATDPDPSDEKRGVSGYMKSLPGEPDFDRIIRFHNPVVERSHTPKVGVTVTKVYLKNEYIDDHFLLGAKVNLENNPKFYGFNGIVADDGIEPIVPFDLSISIPNIQLSRSLEDKSPEFPFNDYKPRNGILIGGNDVVENTGIWDIRYTLSERIEKLNADLSSTTDDIEKYNISERIKFLKSPVATRFFQARMNWFLVLRGNINSKGKTPEIDMNSPWVNSFWMGGWDPDAQNGYVSGILQIPMK